jgi:hypothetical protein
MRPDSTIDYLLLNNNLDKSSSELVNSLESDFDSPIDETSRLNVLAILDALTSDLTVVDYLLLDKLNSTSMPTSGVVTWNTTDDQRSFTNASRLEYAVSYTTDSRWEGTFLAPANRTMINCFIAVRDAIQ